MININTPWLRLWQMMLAVISTSQFSNMHVGIHQFPSMRSTYSIFKHGWTWQHVSRSHGKECTIPQQMKVRHCACAYMQILLESRAQLDCPVVCPSPRHITPGTCWSLVILGKINLHTMGNKRIQYRVYGRMWWPLPENHEIMLFKHGIKNDTPVKFTAINYNQWGVLVIPITALKFLQCMVWPLLISISRPWDR